MVARLRMDSNGLKASKPGINVNSATPAQLSFDTNQAVMLWYSAVHAKPPGTPDAGNPFWAFAYTFPALPWAPCFNFQLYYSGAWRQGIQTGVPPLFNMTSSSSYSITWRAKTDPDTIPLEYVRINIYNLKGQP